MCGCQNKISGMAKRSKKSNTKVTLGMEFFGGLAVAGATGGIITEQLDKLQFIKDNPEMSGTIIGGIKAAGGWYLATKMDKDFVKGAGVGLIVEGASDIFSGLVKGIGSLNQGTTGTGIQARHNRSARVLGTQKRYQGQMRPQHARVKVV